MAPPCTPGCVCRGGPSSLSGKSAPRRSPSASTRGAIWGGLIAPLLILYATTHQIGLSGPILVTTVVGLAIFLVAVLLSPETKGKVLADLTVA
jgi:hypothetical protein